jgi:uncharacterized membrane protein YhaH (DUF805 family)
MIAVGKPVAREGIIMEWMILPYKRYFDFSGRSRRLEYWMFTLFSIIIGAILFSLIIAGGFHLGAFTEPQAADLSFGPIFWLGCFLFGLFWLGSLIPAIALVVRRLHDRDMSGWWYLGIVVASMIPIINIVSGIAFFILMLLPGTPGPNRYGPDPKDPTSSEVFA